ncbi:MAG: S-layer homology domain-containing protein [Bacillota bacterium]
MRAKILAMFILLLFMADLRLAGPARASAAFFGDIDGHWAKEAVIICSIYGLMSGYPGGNFRPDSEITRAEALVVIGRGMGWDLQNRDGAAGLKGLPAGLWEGYRVYIARAAEKQLFSMNDIQHINFAKPATRIEVAAWLARAMGLDGGGTSLHFSDLDGVPPSSREKLSRLVESGIIAGLPGNRFNPHGTLTRAEMASILLRTLDRGRITPPTGHHLVGKLTLKDRSNNKISVQTQWGSFTFGLGHSYLVFRNSLKSSLDSLSLGENVRVSLNHAKKCVFISYFAGSNIPQAAAPPFPEKDVSPAGVPPAQYQTGGRGHVINKYLDSVSVRLESGKVLNVWSHPGINIFINGQKTTSSALKKGTYVEVGMSGADVSAVKILGGERKVYGEVCLASPSSVTIKDDDGKINSYSINNDAPVKDLQGKLYEVHQIKEGSLLEITLDGGDGIRAVLVRESGFPEGAVEKIRTWGDRLITIRDGSGQIRSYYLRNYVQVRENGVSRDLNRVQRGMSVKLTRDTENYITGIEITGAWEIEGRVTHINSSTYGRIEIQKTGGEYGSYHLADGVTVRKYGFSRSPEHISVGMTVRLTLMSSSNTVIGIDITGDRVDPAVVEGVVTYTPNWDYGRIEIQKSGGGTGSYYLAGGVTIRKDGSNLSPGQITPGMKVRLTLDVNYRVTSLDVTGEPDNDEGVVTYLVTSGSGKIEIQRNRGGAATYFLESGVQVRENGAARSLSQITTGKTVKLVVNAYNRVPWIEITGSRSIEGTVEYVGGAGPRRLEVRTGSGLEVHYAPKDVKVREREVIRSIDYIKKGMKVRLVFDTEESVILIDITGLNP